MHQYLVIGPFKCPNCQTQAPVEEVIKSSDDASARAQFKEKRRPCETCARAGQQAQLQVIDDLLITVDMIPDIY
jgi:uncharacterized Zn finger protein (UPF0148 family)